MGYSGQPLKRLEDPRLVAGKGSFVDDIHLPHMLYAAVLRSFYAHALLRSLDVSAARSLPGVVAVLTGEDIAKDVQDLPTLAMTGGWAVDEMHPLGHPVLATTTVCYVGQPVAVVVARERYVARDAVELIQVDYESVPPVLDPFAAIQEGTKPIHQELGTNLGLRINYRGGNLEAAFAQADRVIRQRYHVQRLAPVPLETRGVVADYQPQDDLLTVWSSTQEPHNVRHDVAQLLNRPASRVRVIAPDVGGGFGEKGCLFPEEVVIPYLSLRLGHPVKWVEERRENLLAFHGRGHIADVEAAVKNDGTLLGMRVRLMA